MRNHVVQRHRLPRYADQKKHHNVGEQRDTEHLEHTGNLQTEPAAKSTVTSAPATSAHSALGPTPSRCMPCPIATRSAAMLSAFATTKPTISEPIATRQPRLKRTAINSPSV